MIMHKLLNELSHMIKKHPVDVIKQTKKPLHQQLYVVFEKPSLLNGCEIRHQFEDGETLTWYKGKIINYKNQHFQVYYLETDETCEFTISELKDDFYAGDLWFT